MSVGVVVPAAGMGKRMGTREPKQFLTFHGQPILIHTLALFESFPEIDEMVVVADQKEIGRTQKMIRGAGLQKVTHVVPGGKERQESVYLGLKKISTDWVMVHDAVRPFVSHEAISRLLEEARMHGAAILAVPVKDTVKVVDDAGIVENTPDRKRLWAVQTPQAFRREVLLSAHEHFAGRETVATDDSMLVEEMGVDVRVVQGEYTNIKLTTPDDLYLAEAIYQMRGKKK
ncbi:MULTISPECIES: 2-C-methyl-D-erythritol 4-phosphate cytidylyltransferase [Thermoactinomyces]|uniref:2-C-methyl-D-erythritol 4-phosphate cytidylyltransferase n=1 Tax=Thermoactinomyces TaxID=2023 RepID=UPI001E407B30|nr:MULTISPECIES: 2-C-methyl-D-erythritol 4-phosphate cytidylyltransferase [Thermoactinomyces]MCF6135849.1 2-C-methyl-D-erythritol 4-phosphate cytidylyltransferase [Thermoactinomyces vulgaris]